VVTLVITHARSLSQVVGQKAAQLQLAGPSAAGAGAEATRRATVERRSRWAAQLGGRPEGWSAASARGEAPTREQEVPVDGTVEDIPTTKQARTINYDMPRRDSARAVRQCQ
jgi:hypothetical protein